MSWADYIAWWQDPVNIARAVWCGAWVLGAYKLGYWQGRRRGREEVRDLYLSFLRIGQLVWPGKFEPKKEKPNEN